MTRSTAPPACTMSITRRGLASIETSSSGDCALGDGLAGRASREERIDLRGGPVVHRDPVPVARHVEHQVLAHDREPDDADVRVVHGVIPLGRDRLEVWQTDVGMALVP